MKATGIVRRIDDLGRVVIPLRNPSHNEDKRRRPAGYLIDTRRKVCDCSTWYFETI
jgi:hypothetical protein